MVFVLVVRLLPCQACHLLLGQARCLLPDWDGCLLHTSVCSSLQVEPVMVFSSVVSLGYASVAYWVKEKKYHLLHVDCARH